MSEILPHCRRCETPLGADRVCARCLLETGIGGEEQTSERLFRIALSFDETERAAFIEQAAGKDAALLEEVQMLLEGYLEAGGDAAMPTLGGAGDARSQWAAVRREEPGTVIDHFRLVRLVGEGGMGSVWEAEQTEPIKRRVALKIIKLGMDTEEVVRRFGRERRTLALMTHPHIAQVYEAGATPAGRPYFAMELVAGQAITLHCVAERLGVRERLALFLEVCAAVEHAHQKGVIHRDLKPSNILVSGGIVKVIDFGVAKATRDDGTDALLTRQAQILGTPAYMSPEQAGGDGADVDTRTDVYSLGAVLYELLSGSLPFEPQRLASTHLRGVQRILREEQPPLPSTRIDKTAGPPPVRSVELHGDLDWITLKALSKERERRYPSAAAFGDDVRRYLAGEAVSAVPPTLAYQFGKFVRRHKAAVAAAAAVVLALVAGLIVTLLQVQRANKALAGEAKAREEATFTIADMYTRSGLAAAENGEPSRAALWFANAAIMAAKDPERAAVNRLRAAAWRQEFRPAVHAFDTGFEHIRSLHWNPRQPAMAALPTDHGPAQVWNLETEQQWAHPFGKPLYNPVWSPDGTMLAFKLMEGKSPLCVIVAEYPSGREWTRMEDPGAPEAWSPDGRWVALNGSPPTLWDWRKNEKHPLPHTAFRIRFSADSNRVLLQWDESTGICDIAAPGRFLFPPVATHQLALSDFLGDGTRFAAGTGEALHIHDAATGKLEAAFPGTTGGGDAGALMAVSADGRYLSRRQMPVLDLQEPGQTGLLPHKGIFVQSSFSPDGTLLATGGYDNRLELWSVPDKKFLGETGHHHTGVVNVEFSPDGKFLASGEDGLVRVWSLPLPGVVRKIPAGAATLAVLSPDGGLVAASGFTNAGGSVMKTQAFDIVSGQPAGPEIHLPGPLMDAVFSSEGLWLAWSTTPNRPQEPFETTGGTGSVQLWNPRTGTPAGEAIPLPSEPRGLCLHPSGKRIGLYCAGGEGLEMGITSRTVQTLFKNSKPSNAGASLNNGRCAYSPNGAFLGAWGMNQYIHVWDCMMRQEVIGPSQEANTFDLAFFGNTVVRANVASRMTLDFHFLQTGTLMEPVIPYTNWPFLTRFSEDGSLLLSAGGGSTAQVWNWRTRTLVCPMLAHDETIMAGCFVTGTPWVITGSHDGKIKFWDRRTGMMIRPPVSCPGWVLDLKTTPDGKTLVASGSLAGNIELIDLTAALPGMALDNTAMLRRAEIDADADVHPGGGLAPLTPQRWMQKWRQ